MRNQIYKYFLILFLVLLLYPISYSFSQSVAEIERKYITVNISLESEQHKLDSLNTLLNQRAESINKEKKKNSPDKEKITNLMANSISISNQINEIQKKIVALENKRENIKLSLRKSYERIIDSLNNVKISDKKNPDTDVQILNYSEKKLSIAQKFPDLSFNPALILSLDLSAINNTEERKIFRDYLHKALSEVEDKIVYVERQYAENNEVLSLQKKAEKFIEETEYTDSYRFSRTRGGTEAAIEADYHNSRDYISNAENVKGMLNQFRVIQLGDLKPRSVLSTNVANLSLKEYQNLLKELKDNLIAFSTILNHKIKSFE